MFSVNQINFSPGNLNKNKSFTSIALISLATGTVAVVASLALGAILILAPELIATAGGPYLFIVTGPPALTSLISFATFTLLALRGPRNDDPEEVIKETLSDVESLSLSAGDTKNLPEQLDRFETVVDLGQETHLHSSQSLDSSNYMEENPDYLSVLNILEEIVETDAVQTDEAVLTPVMPTSCADGTACRAHSKDTEGGGRRRPQASNVLNNTLSHDEDDKDSAIEENDGEKQGSSVEERKKEKDKSLIVSDDDLFLPPSKELGGITTTTTTHTTSSRELEEIISSAKQDDTPDIEQALFKNKGNVDPLEWDPFIGGLDGRTLYAPSVPDTDVDLDASKEVEENSAVAPDSTFDLSTNWHQSNEVASSNSRPARVKNPAQVISFTLLDDDFNLDTLYGASSEEDFDLGKEVNDKRVEEQLQEEMRRDTPAPLPSVPEVVPVESAKIKDIVPKEQRLEEKVVIDEKNIVKKKVHAVTTYSLSDISDELIFHIFYFFGSVKELASSSLACKRWNRISHSRELWAVHGRLFDRAVRNKIPKLFIQGHMTAQAVLTADHRLVHGNNPKQEGILTTKLNELNTVFTQLSTFMTKVLLESPKFELKNILSCYLYHQKETAIVRKMITAFHYRSSKKFDTLNARYQKKIERNNTTTIRDLALHARLQTSEERKAFLKALLPHIKNHFGLDDEWVEKRAHQLLDVLFNVASSTDDQLKTFLFALKKTARKPENFADAMQQMLMYLFDKAYATPSHKCKLQVLYQKVMQEVLVKSAAPHTVNPRIEREVRGLFKTGVKFLDGLESFFDEKGEALDQKMDEQFRAAESCDSKPEKAKAPSFEKELYQLEWKETNKHAKRFTLVFVPEARKNKEWNKRLEKLPLQTLRKSKAVIAFEKKHKGKIHFVNCKPATSVLKQLKAYEDARSIRWAGSAVKKVILPILNRLGILEKIVALDGLNPQQKTEWSNLVYAVIDLFMDVAINTFLLTESKSRKAFEKTIKEIQRQVLEKLVEVASSDQPLSWLTLIHTFAPLLTVTEQEFKKITPKK